MTAAPLKHIQPTGSPAEFVIAIRGHMTAAPLKPGKKIDTRAIPRSIRGHMTAAPLKLSIGLFFLLVVWLAIRGHMTAAPLKRRKWHHASDENSGLSAVT